MNHSPILCILSVALLSIPIFAHAGGANAPFQEWGLPILKQSSIMTEFLLSNFEIQDKGLIQREPDDRRREKEHGKGHFRVKYHASSKSNPEHTFVLYLYTKGLGADHKLIFRSIELVPIE